LIVNACKGCCGRCEREDRVGKRRPPPARPQHLVNSLPLLPSGPDGVHEKTSVGRPVEAKSYYPISDPGLTTRSDHLSVAWCMHRVNSGD